MKWLSTGRKLGIILLFLLSFSLSAQELDSSPATDSLWDQAFNELNNLEQNSMELGKIILNLKNQSESDKKLLIEQAKSLEEINHQLTSLEISLNYYKKQDKILKGIGIGLGILIVGETIYIIVDKALSK